MGEKDKYVRNAAKIRDEAMRELRIVNNSYSQAQNRIQELEVDLEITRNNLKEQERKNGKLKKIIK